VEVEGQQRYGGSMTNPTSHYSLRCVSCCSVYIFSKFDSQRDCQVYQKCHSVMPNLQLQGFRAHGAFPEMRRYTGCCQRIRTKPTRQALPLTTRGLCRAVYLELPLRPLQNRAKFTCSNTSVRYFGFLYKGSGDSHYSFEAGSRTAEEEGRSLLGLFLTRRVPFKNM